MKTRKRALCLLVCLSLFLCPGAAALADDSPVQPGAVTADVGELMDDVLDALRGGENGHGIQLPSEWKESLSNFDFSALGDSLKTLLKSSKNLSDEELYAALSRIAEENNLHLVDSQLRQLCSLCRTLEKLNAEELNQRIDKLLSDLASLLEEKDDNTPDPGTDQPSDAGKRFSGIIRFLKNTAVKAVSIVRGLFDRIKKSR